MKEPVSSLAGAPSATVAHPLGGHASADYGVEDDRVVFTDESGPLLRLRVLPSVDATLSEVRSSLRRDPSTASLRGAAVRIDSGDALLDAVSMRRLVVLLRMEYGISVGGLRCTPAALQRFAEQVLQTRVRFSGGALDMALFEGPPPSIDGIEPLILAALPPPPVVAVAEPAAVGPAPAPAVVAGEDDLQDAASNGDAALAAAETLDAAPPALPLPALAVTLTAPPVSAPSVEAVAEAPVAAEAVPAAAPPAVLDAPAVALAQAPAAGQAGRGRRRRKGAAPAALLAPPPTLVTAPVAVVSAEAAAPPVDAAPLLDAGPLLDAAPSALVADNSVVEGAPVDALAPAVEANAVVSDGAAAPLPALAADEPAADLPTGPVTPRGPAAPPAAASPAAAPAASTSLALTANLALSPAEADDGRRPGEVQPVWTREGDRRVLAVSRTLRSGAIIRFPGDVVVYGDVNAGAHIEAGGNIVVLGSLRGLAHAGAQGDEEAIVLGFDLKPAQLRIADHIAFPLDSAAPRSGGLLALFSRDRLAKGGFSPVVALLREGRIVLEDYRGRLPG